MCPLNQDGKCILYKYRPMICRLHGIPHELVKPASYLLSSNTKPISDINSTLISDTNTVLSPGCNDGSELFSAKGYIKFDRTPFYSEMAAIEKEYLIATIGRAVRNRQTIAQMLI
ncbi:MAG: hypothetical protein HQK69_07535 [Desulfamplus sp.]|nr:hypothetical protein [Desulfamplus sp.]